MTNNLSPIKYCFDTCAFIDSWRRYYPPRVFPMLWEQLSDLMKNGRIMVPKEVEKEILAGNDEFKDWFRVNNICVKPYTKEQFEIASEIVNKYPKLSQYNKIKPFHADPFVVALAKVESATVVTWEGPNGDMNNPSVPNLCQEYKIGWFNMIGFFEKEGWSFKSLSDKNIADAN